MSYLISQSKSKTPYLSKLSTPSNYSGLNSLNKNRAISNIHRTPYNVKPNPTYNHNNFNTPHKKGDIYSTSSYESLHKNTNNSGLNSNNSNINSRFNKSSSKYYNNTNFKESLPNIHGNNGFTTSNDKNLINFDNNITNQNKGLFTNDRISSGRFNNNSTAIGSILKQDYSVSLNNGIRDTFNISNKTNSMRNNIDNSINNLNSRKLNQDSSLNGMKPGNVNSFLKDNSKSNYIKNKNSNLINNHYSEYSNKINNNNIYNNSNNNPITGYKSINTSEKDNYNDLNNKSLLNNKEVEDFINQTSKAKINSTNSNAYNNNYSKNDNYGNYNNSINRFDSNLSITETYKKQQSNNKLSEISAYVGLANLGNTCYMNTSLQVLLNCESFISKLMQTKTTKTKTNVTEAFKNLVSQYKEASSKSGYSYNKSISPSEFKRIFERAHRQFSGYNQQDSQEFMRLLLEDIGIETNTITSKVVFKEIDDKGKSKKELKNEYSSYYASREKSVVTDFFNGEFLNIFSCNNCSKENYSFQKFIDIPIYLNSDTGQSVENYLREFFKKEDKIEWSSACSKCNKKSYHTKKAYFSELPHYLMIVFQRYAKHGRKNNSSIHFSNNLDISNFIDKEIINSNNTEYTLKSVSNHTGSLNFGHYYAFCKNNNGNWFECNDSIVGKTSMISNSSNSSSTVYVLVYERL